MKGKICMVLYKYGHPLVNQQISFDYCVMNIDLVYIYMEIWTQNEEAY